MSQTTERVQTPLNIAWRGILVSDIWSINKLSILFLQICKKNFMKTKSTKMSNVMVMKILETIPQSQINVLKIANNSVEWKKVSFNSFEYRTTNFTFSHPGTEQCTSSNNSSSNNSRATHTRQTKVASQLTHTPNYHLKCQGHREDILKNTEIKRRT